MKQCAEAGCPTLVREGMSRCDTHKRQAWRKPASSRWHGGSTRAWRKLRRQVLDEEPLCRVCLQEKASPPAPSTQVDHINPDGGDARENLQGICDAHHLLKTLREANPDIPAGAALAPVTLVCGPAGSGKSTYVERHRKRGDLIVDLDAIFQAISGQPAYDKPSALLEYAQAARDALVARLERVDRPRAWVVATMPDSAGRARLAARLGARVVVLEASASECLSRIAQDPRRADSWEQWRPVVAEWWARYQARAGEELVRFDQGEGGSNRWAAAAPDTGAPRRSRANAKSRPFSPQGGSHG